MAEGLSVDVEAYWGAGFWAVTKRLAAELRLGEGSGGVTAERDSFVGVSTSVM
jgi:hypothetical protein